MRILIAAAVILTMALCPSPMLAERMATEEQIAVPENLGDFRAVFSLEGATEDSLNRAGLTAPVLLESQRNDLEDLAVFNGRDKMVPALLIRAEAGSETLQPQRYNLPLFPLSVAGPPISSRELRYDIPGGKLELKLDGPSEAAAPSERPEGYIIDASAPFSQGVFNLDLRLSWEQSAARSGQASRIKLEISNDLHNWRTLAEDLTILPVQSESQAGEAGAAQGRIVMSHPLEPYLRLTWLDPVDKPRLVAAGLEGSPMRRALTTETIKAVLPGKLETDGTGGPILIYEPGGRPPAVAMNLRLTEAASFKCTLWGRDHPDEQWRRLLKSAPVYRYAKAGGAEGYESNPPWSAPDRSYRYYKLTPDGPWPSFDSPPELMLEFVPFEVVFLAQGGGPYRLAVGHDLSVRRPPAPPEAKQPGTAASTVQIGTIVPVPETLKPAAEVSGPDASLTEVWLFRGVLLFGLFILVAMAIKLYGQMRAEKK
ncbi:hypothetical protein C4J81_00825 [Deltaproteobacteria bacterium Smac51]|nr:hypothetical protein C4J81_00825 [Deltaproteobacteria bacterium Smac51]